MKTAIMTDTNSGISVEEGKKPEYMYFLCR